MGRILGYKHGEGSVENVDPRLWDIVQNAIRVLPYDAEIRSGAEQRGSRGSNHNHGWAVDVTLIDPRTGEKLPDYQSGEAFAAYEQWAQAARVYQQEKYPELDDTFRWGGYFGSPKGFKGYGAGDLMHLDINPNMKGAMSQGSWDKGAGEALLKAYSGARTNGGLGGAEGARRVAQIRQTFKGSGGLVPPSDITPVPATMSDATRDTRLAFGAEAGALAPQDDLTRRMSPAPRSRDSLLSRARGDVFAARDARARADAVAARDEGKRLAATGSVSMDNIGASQRTGQGVREGTMSPGVRLTNREGGQDIAMYSSAGTDMSVTGGQPRVTAGTQSMTDEQRRAMREVPEETPPRVSVAPTGPQGRGRPVREQKPGVIKTAGGIAGTAQLPRDVRPSSVETLPLPGAAAIGPKGPSGRGRPGSAPALQPWSYALSEPSRTAPVPATQSAALAQRRSAPALMSPVPATQSAALQAQRSSPTRTSMTAPVPASRGNLEQLRAQYGQGVGVSMTGNIFMRDPSTMTGYRILGRVDQPQPQQAAQRPAPALQQPSSSGGGGGGQSWFETVKSGGVYG